MISSASSFSSSKCVSLVVSTNKTSKHPPCGEGGGSIEVPRYISIGMRIMWHSKDLEVMGRRLNNSVTRVAHNSFMCVGVYCGPCYSVVKGELFCTFDPCVCM